MKYLTLILSLFIFSVNNLDAQLDFDKKEVTSADGSYTYVTFEGDPTETRIYRLKNGLTVYLSPNEEEPRLNTAIAVRAGSKNDPSHATGLAHYLEHMLFKGTDKLGSLNYEKEKVLIDRIAGLFEKYRGTKDESQRKQIYAEIDSLSHEASKYAIAGEYDKALSSMGAKGTNAFTWHEQTVYINDIPANMVDRWLMVEAERFRNPVLRLFHTELEAVYEEKNRSLDSDRRQMLFTLMENLFKNHNYGQQTTIGTIEHLKNPSMKAIQEYYEKYYRPNNMAICISGDMDPDVLIRKIDERFSYMTPGEIEEYRYEEEKPIEKPVIKEVYGPESEMVVIGFRLPPKNNPSMYAAKIIDQLLSNGTAGLLDLNLNQKQKVRNAYSAMYELNDYSVHMLGAMPKEGQSHAEVKDLLLRELEKIKNGEFEEDIMIATINELEKNRMKTFQTNRGRAMSMMTAFISHQEWSDVLAKHDRMRMLKKADVMQMANELYRENYVAVYKKDGERNNGSKIEKPEITPVVRNEGERSDFLARVMETPAGVIKPDFLDYSKDITFLKTSSGIPVHYVKNDLNGLFTMYYMLDMGERHDKVMSLAVEYLPYLGTSDKSAEQINKELYILGCDFSVTAEGERSYIYLNGLQQNFEEGMKLFEELLANAAPDETALKNLINDKLKAREDAKKSRRNIMYSGLVNYALYGDENPFNDVLSEDELNALTAEELVEKIHSLTSFEHRVLYHGPSDPDYLLETLNKHHKTSGGLREIPEETDYDYRDQKKPTVFFAEYDMVQAEILWMHKSKEFEPELIPVIRLFNEYYGGSMSSVVFQTIRESRALAYSTWSNFNVPSEADKPHYMLAYVGTQADKIHDAIAAMNDLITEMPQTEQSLEGSKEAIINQIKTERILRTGILFNYESARKRGLDFDIRQPVYMSVPDMDFEDLKKFHSEYISGKTYDLLILGSKDKIDLDELKQYGKVKEVSLEELFGY